MVATWEGLWGPLLLQARVLAETKNIEEALGASAASIILELTGSTGGHSGFFLNVVTDPTDASCPYCKGNAVRGQRRGLILNGGCRAADIAHCKSDFH